MEQEEHAGSVPKPAVEATIPAALTHLVSRIICYDADGIDGNGDREIASFVIPIIFSFADPFLIAFDRPPLPDERIGSFVSGLHPGYVDIDYGGPVSCVQIDLTPLGAGLFFCRPMSDFATRLVPLQDVGDPALNDLRERLGAAGTRPARLRITVAFLEQRLLGQPVDPSAAFIWSAIQRSRGALRIDRLTDDLGWSRKRLAAHARDAFGLTPKRLARIARFHHAIDLANSAGRPDWAGIAVDCGYADQAHLVRDFTTFAGAAPERWRNRESEAPRNKSSIQPSGTTAKLRWKPQTWRLKMTEAPRIYPTFRYRDPAAMIAWLCDTVGFTVHARHPAEGDVAHAELAYGSSMIMLGAVRDDAYGALVGAPGQDGGKSIYVAVEEVDALHDRVLASGVLIEEELVDRDYGSREFTCRDPEGNLWCFGTYWPKRE